MLLESLYKTPAGILINSRVLKELFSNHLGIFQTGGRDKFYIYLEPLSGRVHFFIGLRNVLWIRGMYSHDPLFPEEAVKPGNGAGIAALPEFDPKDHKTGIRISSAHIHNQLNFFRGVLIGVVMRSARALPEGVSGAVITSFPAVDILPIGFIFDGSFCDTKFFSVLN